MIHGVADAETLLSKKRSALLEKIYQQWRKLAHWVSSKSNQRGETLLRANGDEVVNRPDRNLTGQCRAVCEAGLGVKADDSCAARRSPGKKDIR